VLFCDPKNQGNNTLLDGNKPANSSSHLVKVEPLKTYYGDLAGENILIKLDVQGYEYEILRGLERQDATEHAYFILEIDAHTTADTFNWIADRWRAGKTLVCLDERNQSIWEVTDMEKLRQMCTGSHYCDVLLH
jgi:hypothetical protein